MESSKFHPTLTLLYLILSQILCTKFVDTVVIKADEEDSAVPKLSETGTDLNPNLNFIQGGLTNRWVVFQVLAELSSLLSADETADVLLDPEVGGTLSPAQLDAVLSSLSAQALERIPQLITKVSLIRKFLDFFG
jgi:hypothetical protein